jgi:hypothetical protein
MKLNLKQLLPTSYELIAGFLLTITIIILANTKQLLSYYGLQSSDNLIKSSAGHAVSDALKAIDSLSATDGVVTFLIWAVVGILCFGIVEAIGRAYSELKFENDLSSGQYVHPATFTKLKFWRGVFVDSIALGLGLAVLLVDILAFTLFLIPLGLAYSRVFLFDISVVNGLYMLLGLVVTFVGWVALDIAVRFLLHRHRIVSLS